MKQSSEQGKNSKLEVESKQIATVMLVIWKLARAH